jgi:hypothetical protein
MTYLHYFARAENAQICNLLLWYDADPNVRCNTTKRYKYSDDEDEAEEEDEEEEDNSDEEEVGGYTCFDVWPDLHYIVKYHSKKKMVEMGEKASRASLLNDIQIICK